MNISLRNKNYTAAIENYTAFVYDAHQDSIFDNADHQYTSIELTEKMVLFKYSNKTRTKRYLVYIFSTGKHYYYAIPDNGRLIDIVDHTIYTRTKYRLFSYQLDKYHYGDMYRRSMELRKSDIVEVEDFISVIRRWNTEYYNKKNLTLVSYDRMPNNKIPINNIKILTYDIRLNFVSFLSLNRRLGYPLVKDMLNLILQNILLT